MQYSPLEDRILVRPIKTAEEKTESGIFIPVTVKKDVVKGEVYRAGNGVYARETGALIPTFLAKGDIVLFGADAGMPIPVETENGNEEMRILREGDILLLVDRPDKNS